MSAAAFVALITAVLTEAPHLIDAVEKIIASIKGQGPAGSEVDAVRKATDDLMARLTAPAK